MPATVLNAFRVLADVAHTASKCILIWAIHWNRSAEGVSFLTQLMYIIVFLTRYLNLFWTIPWLSWWISFLKIFYITTSVYVILLMTIVYGRTREKEKSWKLAIYITLGTVVATPVIAWISDDLDHATLSYLCWLFSLILEAFCVLPQLILLRQTSTPTVIDSYYLLTLGSYRAFYIMNWIYRAAHNDKPNKTKVIFGVIQTLFYLDFAWVYWTRQRVKLRAGGIVDSDDLRKAWFVKHIMDRNTDSEDVEADSAVVSGTVAGKKAGVSRWGQRGISISADHTPDDLPGDDDEHDSIDIPALESSDLED